MRNPLIIKGLQKLKLQVNGNYRTIYLFIYHYLAICI